MHVCAHVCVPASVILSKAKVSTGVQNGRPHRTLDPTCTLSPEPFELCSCLLTGFTWKPGCDFRTQQGVNVDCPDGEVRAWSHSGRNRVQACAGRAGASGWSMELVCKGMWPFSWEGRVFVLLLHLYLKTKGSVCLVPWRYSYS